MVENFVAKRIWGDVKTSGFWLAGSLNSYQARFDHAFKPNDKIIIISGAGYNKLRETVHGFRVSCGDRATVIRPRIVRYAEKGGVIIFPFDIKLDSFMQLVNYLVYPIDVSWKARITGWATVNFDDLKPGKKDHAKVMVFVPDDDTEHDNVFMTSVANNGYKYTFDGTFTKLDKPNRPYAPQAVEINELTGLPFEDVE
jgi:hypothetical protein